MERIRIACISVRASVARKRRIKALVFGSELIAAMRWPIMGTVKVECNKKDTNKPFTFIRIERPSRE